MGDKTKKKLIIISCKTNEKLTITLMECMTRSEDNTAVNQQ